MIRAKCHVSVGTHSNNMRSLMVLGSLLLITVCTRSWASPCECNTDRGPIIVTEEPPVIQSPPDHTPAGPRTEINTNVSKNSSQINTTSNTKASQKIKTKEGKDGTTVTVTVDKSRTKNKTDALTDSYDQTNRTVIDGGIEDHTSLTKEKQQQLKEVSVAKNVTKQMIVTDKYGHVISNTVKAKTSEKDRKSEKTKESETLIHTVKQVTTEAPEQCVTVPSTPPPTPENCVTVPPPTPEHCVTVPPTPPPTTTTTTTTTTEPPRPPCGCRRTTTTTEASERPCGCKRG